MNKANMIAAESAANKRLLILVALVILVNANECPQEILMGQ